MRRLLALCCAGAVAASAPADGVLQPSEPRIEARSAEFIAVGIVHGDRMTVHVSRLVDNAPVRDAVVTVVLRGITHPTLAEADGSYTLQTHDLDVPGSAALVFQVEEGGKARSTLAGTLQVAGEAGKPEDKNSARQLGWWVLNFAVCIGFLMLISRRRKAAAERNEDA